MAIIDASVKRKGRKERSEVYITREKITGKSCRNLKFKRKRRQS